MKQIVVPCSILILLVSYFFLFRKNERASSNGASLARHAYRLPKSACNDCKNGAKDQKALPREEQQAFDSLPSEMAFEQQKFHADEDLDREFIEFSDLVRSKSFSQNQFDSAVKLLRTQSSSPGEDSLDFLEHQIPDLSSDAELYYYELIFSSHELTQPEKAYVANKLLRSFVGLSEIKGADPEINQEVFHKLIISYSLVEDSREIFENNLEKILNEYDDPLFQAVVRMELKKGSWSHIDQLNPIEAEDTP